MHAHTNWFLLVCFRCFLLYLRNPSRYLMSFKVLGRNVIASSFAQDALWWCLGLSMCPHLSCKPCQSNSNGKGPTWNIIAPPCHSNYKSLNIRHGDSAKYGFCSFCRSYLCFHVSSWQRQMCLSPLLKTSQPRLHAHSAAPLPLHPPGGEGGMAGHKRQHLNSPSTRRATISFQQPHRRATAQSGQVHMRPSLYLLAIPVSHLIEK